MRIIHSFWSKPCALDANLSIDDRINGGWSSNRYHIYSWVLSCLKALENHRDVELITDNFGKLLMIDLLKLPYKRVSTELNNLSGYSTDLWALGKIYSYSIQKAPFVHIDGDVYLWKSLPTNLMKKNLISQNIEYNHTYYHEILKEMRLKVKSLPDFLFEIDYANIVSSNAGIIGGIDYPFFKRFGRCAFDFVDANKTELQSLVNPSLSNVIIEQLFFTCLAKVEKKTISYLFNDIDPSYQQLIEFHRIPSKTTFTHVVGKNAKRSFAVAKKVELFLQKYYPEYYKKVNKLLNEFQS